MPPPARRKSCSAATLAALMPTLARTTYRSALRATRPPSRTISSAGVSICQGLPSAPLPSAGTNVTLRPSAACEMIRAGQCVIVTRPCHPNLALPHAERQLQPQPHARAPSGQRTHRACVQVSGRRAANVALALSACNADGAAGDAGCPAREIEQPPLHRRALMMKAEGREEEAETGAGWGRAGALAHVCKSPLSSDCVGFRGRRNQQRRARASCSRSNVASACIAKDGGPPSGCLPRPSQRMPRAQTTRPGRRRRRARRRPSRFPGRSQGEGTRCLRFAGGGRGWGGGGMGVRCMALDGWTAAARRPGRSHANRVGPWPQHATEVGAVSAWGTNGLRPSSCVPPSTIWPMPPIGPHEMFWPTTPEVMAAQSDG